MKKNYVMYALSIYTIMGMHNLNAQKIHVRTGFLSFVIDSGSVTTVSDIMSHLHELLPCICFFYQNGKRIPNNTPLTNLRRMRFIAAPPPRFCDPAK